MTQESGLILALDQGTTTSRAIVFNRKGMACSIGQYAFNQYYPQPGWVEHDALEILSSQLAAITDALVVGEIDPQELRAIGITNQRETTVIWNRFTGTPIAPAIVWQCRRTASLIAELTANSAVHERIRRTTGLVPDAYFSASKIAWLLDNVPHAREQALAGELAFGTIDSWLVWQLTGGATHATDYTNASRTMLFDIHKGEWSEWLLELFNVPAQLLPEVRPSAAYYGCTVHPSLPAGIPICGVAGDQQAALFGQGCFAPGEAKNTYGTGCFFLVHAGTEAPYSEQQLIITIAASAPVASVTPSASAAPTLQAAPGAPVAALPQAAPVAPVAALSQAAPTPKAAPATPITPATSQLEYAIEGSVFVSGALIQWLRDELGLIQSAGETQRLAQSVPHTAGVYLVPAFAGLGAPYWDGEARGALLGLTRGSTKAHIVRAALEAMAFQLADLVDAVVADTGLKLEHLKVDGGGAANNFLLQFQSDILNLPIVRPANTETTALGVAFLAGLTSGLWQNTDELRALITGEGSTAFTAKMSAEQRAEKLRGWRAAVDRVRS